MFRVSLRALRKINDISFADFRAQFPLLSKVLTTKCFEKDFKTLADAFGSLEILCDGWLSVLSEIKIGLSLLDLQREAQGVPESTDLLARYQSALDNDLYKAMRALREAQAWRQKTIVAEIM